MWIYSTVEEGYSRTVYCCNFRIVAIQFLHKSETVQKIKSNQLKMKEHQATLIDIKPNIKKISPSDGTKASISELNLELADDIDLTRVSVKSKVSLRHLSRKNYVLDALKARPVFEGRNEMYKVSPLYLQCNW